MSKTTKTSLINDGYEIQNAKITGFNFSMADHGCIVMNLYLSGDCWGCDFGGQYCLGHGYVGANNFDGSGCGIEYLERILDIVGVSNTNNLVGQYVRVAIKGNEDICIVGNIINDKWFNVKNFFSSYKDNSVQQKLANAKDKIISAEHHTYCSDIPEEFMREDLKSTYREGYGAGAKFIINKLKTICEADT